MSRQHAGTYTKTSQQRKQKTTATHSSCKKSESVKPQRGRIEQYTLTKVHATSQPSPPRMYPHCTTNTANVLAPYRCSIKTSTHSAMTGWLHGICMSVCCFSLPRCGFSLSLFCIHTQCGARIPNSTTQNPHRRSVHTVRPNQVKQAYDVAGCRVCGFVRKKNDGSLLHTGDGRPKPDQAQQKIKHEHIHVGKCNCVPSGGGCVLIRLRPSDHEGSASLMSEAHQCILCTIIPANHALDHIPTPHQCSEVIVHTFCSRGINICRKDEMILVCLQR